ncbi:uncharacterized protein LOC122511982 [Leptopilina heterotoma]|uniref:uncharacterized protein LOC122511982 n=1 Tax=Leptopilina heterotoma TaxID=63436 RepID=UPI001CA81283|nr:uncharacterized protein LOC122511982 [Leptopilina heterotoma]
MSICDHEYKFNLVDIGSFGGCNDAGIFEDSLISEGLFNGILNLPDEQFQIPNFSITTPIFLVGDDIFPISTKLLKPYPGSYLSDEQKVFNYRLSRARRIVENAFGIMASRWRILYTKISADPQKVDNIVMAIICLHNFLMSINNKADTNRQQYCPASHVDRETEGGRVLLGDWQFDGNDQLKSFPPIQPERRGTLIGQQMRNTLAAHFSSPSGEVPWQWDYIR